MYDCKELFPTPEERVVAREVYNSSLKHFIKYLHKYITGSEFEFREFHDPIIKALEERACYKTIKNLMINMPVGFGKSLIVEYFILWCFCRNINNCFLYTSYSDGLITKLSKEIKDMIDSESFQWLWGLQLKKDERSKVKWSFDGATGRSGLTAGAMGGSITGLDAGNPIVKGFCGALIIDDPISASKVIFDNAREDCLMKYSNALQTRLRRSDVPTILIMQRLDEQDLAGHIIENEADDWNIITVQALQNGKSIWEKKITTEQLKKKREKYPTVFLSQYQQEPNNNINSSFANAQYEENQELIHNGIGHIDKGFDGADFTAFTIMKKIDDKIVAFGILFDKHIDSCIDEIVSLKEKHKCGTIYTENNDDKGALAKSEKVKKAKLIIGTYHESMNKHYKIMTYLYPAWKEIRWINGTDDNYIRQIQSYKETSKYDDAPDSASSLIKKINYGKKFQIRSA